MTEELNELASAYVDGETTPEETARVEADPEARKLAQSIRRISTRVSSVEPQTAETRELHIANALAAFTGSASKDSAQLIRPDLEATQTVDRPKKVVPLATHSSQEPNKSQETKTDDEPGFTDPKIEGLVGNVVPISTNRRRRWTTPLAAAAGIALVAGAGLTVFSSQNSFTESTEEASTSAVPTADDAMADESFEEVSEAEADSGESAEESFDGEEASLDSETVEILSFDVLPDQAELEEIVASSNLEGEGVPSSVCGTAMADSDGGALLGVVPIMVNGELVELVVFSSDANRLGFAVSAVDNQCQPMAER